MNPQLTKNNFKNKNKKEKKNKNFNQYRKNQKSVNEIVKSVVKSTQKI